MRLPPVLLAFSLLVACGDKDPDEGTPEQTDDCTELTFFLDADGDGHGGSESVSLCEAPSGYVSQSTDCDDSSAQIHPDAGEVCDGIDNNCDGTADNDPTDGQTLYTLSLIHI